MKSEGRVRVSCGGSGATGAGDATPAKWPRPLVMNRSATSGSLSFLPRNPRSLNHAGPISTHPLLPPFNGCVERANDSARVEFWNLYTGELTVAAAGAALTEYQHFYNHLRPHRTLDMMTPMEYLATWKAT